MGQIHSRKSITASADTDPKFEVHDQELMLIPLPLARLGASSACFLSNGEGKQGKIAVKEYRRYFLGQERRSFAYSQKNTLAC